MLSLLKCKDISVEPNYLNIIIEMGELSKLTYYEKSRMKLSIKVKILSKHLERVQKVWVIMVNGVIFP